MAVDHHDTQVQYKKEINTRPNYTTNNQKSVDFPISHSFSIKPLNEELF